MQKLFLKKNRVNFFFQRTLQKKNPGEKYLGMGESLYMTSSINPMKKNVSNSCSKIERELNLWKTHDYVHISVTCLSKREGPST